MSLLPTPHSMPIMASGEILPIIGHFGHRHQQLYNQPYLLVNPDQSMYQNYYLVYVPLIGSPSTSSAPHMVASTMSTSLLQASTLLNSLLTATSLYNAPPPSLASALVRKPNLIPATASSSSLSSSSIALIREQYRYNMRPSYRYVLHC